MRKGRRERIEKGSRDGIEKETKRQFEEKEGRVQKNVPLVKQNAMKLEVFIIRKTKN